MPRTSVGCKNMSEYTLRKAKPEDCDELLRWRNDAESRGASFNQSIIRPEAHAQWFSAILVDKRRRIMIAIGPQGERAGMVRFDMLNGNYIELSINLAPEMRGRGLGVEIIKLACQKMPGTNFIARTKEVNPASLKTFSKAGFVRLFDYNDVEHGKVVVLGLARA